MEPKDSRNSAKTNGNVHPGGKGKGKAKVSRTSSTASLQDLTPEDVETGIVTLRQLSKIFDFLQIYRDEIDDVESIYSLGIRQQTQINELETTINNLAFRRDQEMMRLQEKNNEYQANAGQFEREREELKHERAALNDTHKKMRLEVERQKEKEINEAKQESSDKLKNKVKQAKDELGKKIQALETEGKVLKDTIQTLKKEKIQAKQDLDQQRQGVELEKRSFQSHIMCLEHEINQIKAASVVSPQKPEFYSEGFRQLWESIRDVAVNHFKVLPEDVQPLDSDTVRNRLFSASAIFKFSPLTTESDVATFLRACAIENFLSTKLISIIGRQYFAEPAAAVERSSGTRQMDSILESISNVPAVTSSQELSWRLTTVDKLDRLGSQDPSTRTDVFTQPSQENIVEEILDLLHHFRRPDDTQLHIKLSEMTRMTIKLWSSLRKDSCRIHFEYNPSTNDWQEWKFVDNVSTDGSKAASVPNKNPVAQPPSQSFMLFPRIAGSFDSDNTTSRILHTGVALSGESPVLQEGLQEIENMEAATREFKRSLRRGSSAQSSPVTVKLQKNWSAPHRGFD